jgi:nucleotide-binding universal stress UspA family protein
MEKTMTQEATAQSNSLRTMVVAVSGGAASEGAVETACRLAARFGAHLEGFHVRVDPAEILMQAGNGFAMPISGEWVDRLVADTAELAAKTKASFTATAARHKLTLETSSRDQASASWHEESGYAPVLVARRARFFDLAVLGRSERVIDRPHTDTVEQTLVHSGRPVLLAPAKPPAMLGQTVAVGWNGSPEAVHVIAATLAVLRAAETVTIITVGDEHSESPVALLDYLAWHGIAAKHRQVLTVAGVGPGEQLLAEARDQGADLLVMGGYGHRPWRELLFGGATRQVVGASLLPVLLAH